MYLTGVFSIQQMSAASGLSIDTLRYYEKIGLLRPERDPSSHHRRYSQTDLRWLSFVGKLRSTGMPLAQIRLYGELFLQGDSTIPERRALMQAQAKEVEGQIAHLQEVLVMIQEKLESYPKERT